MATQQHYYQQNPQIDISPYQAQPGPPPQYNPLSPSPAPDRKYIRTPENNSQPNQLSPGSVDHQAQAQPWQQPYLPPQHQTYPHQPVAFPALIQTENPYQNAYTPYREHLQRTRSYSEPPSHGYDEFPIASDNHGHRHRHARLRSPSRASESSRSRSRSRRRRRHREHERERELERESNGHKHREREMDREAAYSRREHEKSKKKKNRALWGALGGGAIGDLIFPGLGTVGGALLGGLGGSQIKSSHDKVRRISVSARGGRRDRDKDRDRDRSVEMDKYEKTRHYGDWGDERRGRCDSDDSKDESNRRRRRYT